MCVRETEVREIKKGKKDNPPPSRLSPDIHAQEESSALSRGRSFATFTRTAVAFHASNFPTIQRRRPEPSVRHAGTSGNVLVPPMGIHRLPWWLPMPLGRADAIDGTDALLTAKETQIVDLRWQFEFDRHHLIGARRCPLLPGLSSFEQRLTELRLSPTRPTVVICEHAVRSPLGVKKLRAMGFTNVRQLRGGMSRWLRVPDVPLARSGAADFGQKSK